MGIHQAGQERGIAQVDHLQTRREKLGAADRGDPLSFDHHHRIAADGVALPVDEPGRAQGDPAGRALGRLRREGAGERHSKESGDQGEHACLRSHGTVLLGGF